MPNRRNLFSAVLWASYVLTMAASIGHLAWTFGTLEPAGSQWAGWLPALAVDAGLAALAYAIQHRKRARRGTRSLWLGVAVFAGISAYANTLHALSVAPAELAKALILSAVLPILVVYLGEIISADDVAAADAAERERMRAEKAQMQADARAMRDNAPALPEQAETDAAQMRRDAARKAAQVRWDAVRAQKVNGHADALPAPAAD